MKQEKKTDYLVFRLDFKAILVFCVCIIAIVLLGLFFLQQGKIHNLEMKVSGLQYEIQKLQSQIDYTESVNNELNERIDHLENVIEQ